MKAEDLFETLGEVDESLVTQAYAADSAENLKRLCDAEKEMKRQTKEIRTSARLRPMYRRVAVIGVSFALIVGLALGMPMLMQGSGHRKEEPTLSPDDPGLRPVSGWDDVLANATGEIVINNLDKLNYYAARWLMDADRGALQQGAPSLIPLSLTSQGVGSDHGSAVNTPPVEDAPPEEPSPTLGDPLPGAGSGSIGEEHWVGDRVVYYALEPEDCYTIDAVLHFQIELTDPQGFLASRVGTGTVDVVITSNNLEPMITFRQGDRFYSCLVSGGGEGQMIFSTHKYIDGFSIVKNLEQDNFSFRVTFGENGVRGIECVRHKSGVRAEEQIYLPDAITLLPGDGIWYEVSGTFRVAELQGYYNALNAQKGDLS